ncbi:MAG: pseudoazurin [Pseudomonadota bacterium]
MSLSLTRRMFMALSSAFLVTRPSFAAGQTVEVKMYNKDPENKKNRYVFIPRIVKVKPGDTVNFVSVDKGHNSASTKGMLPEGAEPWKGKISKDIAVTFEKPGIYGYQCTPHRAVGMVGAVIVEGEGMANNLEAAKSAKQIGKARKVWKEIWAEIEEKGMLSS